VRKPLPLAYYGHAVLRQRAAPIETIDESTRQLADELLFAMLHYDGLGLAANQVHHSVRMFAMRGYDLDQEDNPIWKEPQIILNPVLLDPSDELEEDEEGCLSIPGFRAPVVRPVAITLQGLNLAGEPFERRLEGIEARIAMHETDHLNGRFFFERLPKRERDLLERRIKAKQPSFGRLPPAAKTQR
jgi:peptide deformylase